MTGTSHWGQEMSFPGIKEFTLRFCWMNIRVTSSTGHIQVRIFSPLS